MSTAEKKWNSWSDMKIQYQESRKRLQKYIGENKGSKDTQMVVQLSEARSMVNELKEVEVKIESHILYGYEDINKEFEKYDLTDRQREVLKFRQKYKTVEVAKKLGMTKQGVYEIYKQVLNKILKIKKREINNIEKLSVQQKKIYELQKVDKTNLEISQELGLSVNAVKVQKNRIKKKLGLTKTT